jgi:hypothetical protein
MPIRISRSFSVRGPMGTRVRFTASQSVGRRRPAGPNVQIRLTGRDILEMQRQEAEAEAALQVRVEQLRAEHQRRKTAHLSSLGALAVWLHRSRVAVAALATYALLLLLTFVAPSGIGSLALLALIAVTVVLAFADWWAFRTLGGRINWRLLKLTHPHAYWWAVIGMVCLICSFFFVPGLFWLWDCVRTAPAVAELRRAELQQDIARLERELLPR